jgi:hypothetical protein
VINNPQNPRHRESSINERLGLISFDLPGIIWIPTKVTSLEPTPVDLVEPV